MNLGCHLTVTCKCFLWPDDLDIFWVSRNYAMWPVIMKQSYVKIHKHHVRLQVRVGSLYQRSASKQQRSFFSHILEGCKFFAFMHHFYRIFMMLVNKFCNFIVWNWVLWCVSYLLNKYHRSLKVCVSIKELFILWFSEDNALNHGARPCIISVSYWYWCSMVCSHTDTCYDVEICTTPVLHVGIGTNWALILVYWYRAKLVQYTSCCLVWFGM